MSVAVQLPLNDVLQTVSRPVVFAVMRELRDIMRISNDAEIRYYGDDGAASQAGSTINIATDTQTQNRWPHVENLTVEVNEVIDPDLAHTVQVMRYDSPPIFFDPGLGVYLWPIYTPKKVEITIQYKAQDRNSAERWANEMRTRYIQGRDVLWHQVNYSYNLPGQILQALLAIHTLREKVAPYGETFEKWLRSCFSERATIVTNLAGEQKELAIAESQVKVQGYFENVLNVSAPSKDADTYSWVSSITYTYTYQQPTGVVMKYPLVVHQQLMPRAFRPPTPIQDFQEAFKQWQVSTGCLEPFGAQNQGLMTMSNEGLVVPSFDTFKPRSIQMATVRAFMGIAGISADDKKSLMDFNVMGDFRFHTDVLNFIKAVEWQYMCVPYASVIQVTHYEGVRIQEQSEIELSSDLMLSLKQDGDLRTTYRVRIGLVVDFDLLPQAALDRLKQYPLAAIRIIQAINAAIRSRSNHSDIGKSRMTPEDLNRINLGYNDDWSVVTKDKATQPVKGNALIELALIETLYVVANPLEQN